ncbi:MAG: HD domain-containing protein [Oscillospiraceae bacterium]|nr:HD domain-containing protein [Oscillospiraceae bacterium]
MLIPILEILAIVIPCAGISALLHNQQHSESSIRLLLTSIGCFIMNTGTLLMETAQTETEAAMALRFEYLGNAAFYYFFISFLIAYLRLKGPKLLLYCWAAFECTVAVMHWNEKARELFIGHYYFVQHPVFHVFTAQVDNQSPLYTARNTCLLLILCAGMVYTVYRMHQNKLPSEKRNLARLTAAQFIVAAALAMDVCMSPELELMPVFCSLSLLSVVISMLTDGFFGVTDSGHEWVFNQMTNPYVITDQQYGYLDANDRAKALFPALNRIRRNERIPDEVLTLFNSTSNRFAVGEENFERKLSTIRRKDQIVGYSMLLEDDTEQQKYVKLLNTYNQRLHSEVDEKTEHIRKVQNSIITGMASVVESRDNSTGGHINRTSNVVRIFARHLRTKPELMEQFGLTERMLHNITKAAPMHDLGKIAVDDVILRKPGRFTDEEYAQMKKHPAEGMKVLKKVLNEVDDTDFKQIAYNIANYHHERYDGKGYPNGCAGEDIPVEARIMALADVFDALVSKRCYKEAFGFDKAFSIIEEGLGTQFDPVLGAAFLECRDELEKMYTVPAAQ